MRSFSVSKIEQGVGTVPVAHGARRKGRLDRVFDLGHAAFNFAPAGLGEPQGTTVAGHLEPLRDAGAMLSAVYRSVLPAATQLGLTSTADGERWLEDFARDMHEHGDHAALWPLLIGAWKRKPQEQA